MIIVRGHFKVIRHPGGANLHLGWYYFIDGAQEFFNRLCARVFLYMVHKSFSKEDAQEFFFRVHWSCEGSVVNCRKYTMHMDLVLSEK